MARINDLIYHLQGTPISLEEGCNDLGFDSNDLTEEELLELDNWLFQCSGCGWWYDVGERSDIVFENVCLSCALDYEDEEDE